MRNLTGRTFLRLQWGAWVLALLVGCPDMVVRYNGEPICDTAGNPFGVGTHFRLILIPPLRHCL